MSEMIANLNDMNLGKLNELVTDYVLDTSPVRGTLTNRAQFEVHLVV